MALTAEQLADMQGDLGISDDELVFTDDELNRLFERADSDYNTAVYLAWRQIVGGAVNWIDYRVAQTSLSRDQAWQHAMAMLAFWKDESRTAANQLRILGLTEIPPRIKDDPDKPATRIRDWNRGLF